MVLSNAFYGSGRGLSLSHSCPGLWSFHSTGGSGFLRHSIHHTARNASHFVKNLKNTLQLLEFIKVARGGHSAARIIKNQRMSESSKVDVCKALDIVIRSLTPCFRVQFIVFKWDTLRGNCLLPRTLAVFLQNGSHCVDFDHDIDHRCLQQYFLV